MSTLTLHGYTPCLNPPPQHSVNFFIHVYIMNMEKVDMKQKLLKQIVLLSEKVGSIRGVVSSIDGVPMFLKEFMDEMANDYDRQVKFLQEMMEGLQDG